MQQKSLVAWIGATDLKASREENVGAGPIANAVDVYRYCSIELLCNYPQSDADQYVVWLGSRTDSPITARHFPLSSPMHYGEVYEAADRVVSELLTRGCETLVFHLSPGTPATLSAESPRIMCDRC